MIKNLYSAKHDDKWIKIIDNIDFDVKQYQNFYNYVGYQFLPKLYDYSIIEGNKAKFVMAYLDGKQVSMKNIRALFDFVCHTIFPSFMQWTILNRNHMIRDKKENFFYYHNDLKPENFLVIKNKFMLIDIDAMCLTNINDKIFKIY